MKRYPESIPDDYRRNLYDLESMIEWGQRYPDEDGGPDVVHMTTTPEHADLIAARFAEIPRNVLIVQTPRGRFQIDVSDYGIRVVCLDGSIVVAPYLANIVDLSKLR